MIILSMLTRGRVATEQCLDRLHTRQDDRARFLSLHRVQICLHKVNLSSDVMYLCLGVSRVSFTTCS